MHDQTKRQLSARYLRARADFIEAGGDDPATHEITSPDEVEARIAFMRDEIESAKKHQQAANDRVNRILNQPEQVRLTCEKMAAIGQIQDLQRRLPQTQSHKIEKISALMRQGVSEPEAARVAELAYPSTQYSNNLDTLRARVAEIEAIQTMALA